MKYFIYLKYILVNYSYDINGRYLYIDKKYEKYINHNMYIIYWQHKPILTSEEITNHCIKIENSYNFFYVDGNNKTDVDTVLHHNLYVEIKDNISFCKAKMLHGE